MSKRTRKHTHALQHLFSKSGQWVVICQWVSDLQVSISLCLNRLSIAALALPVYLSHWPPLWRATGAECSGQPRGQALTWPASKLRQSLPRVELPQAAMLSTGVVCSDKKAASWSKHTHTKRKERQKEKGGWEANSEVLSQVSFVWKVTQWFGKSVVVCWVCSGICLMDIVQSMLLNRTELNRFHWDSIINSLITYAYLGYHRCHQINQYWFFKDYYFK